LSPGPAGVVIGSSVCNGSGTIPAQTTMCKTFAILLPFSKINRIPSALKGHGFSRANKCQIKILGFSP
jgi:hypothetical protein